MQLHQLKPIHQFKKRKRVGRGGKRGTYSGKGMKGQKSRAGRKFQPVIRELIKKYPKLRGYRFKPKTKNQKSKITIVNLEELEKKFKDSDIISPKILLDKKIIRRIKGKIPQVKILGKGKMIKKIIIENCEISKSAKEKIEKAGGSILIKSKIKPVAPLPVIPSELSKNQKAKI